MLADTLPNLVVIGAMKCATTSLHHYLDLHPEISMARQRGLNAFLAENAGRSIDWYASHFDLPGRIRGDTSPRYTNAPLNPGVPARLHAWLPEARLVYVVRDPVARMVSHYTHYVASGYERRAPAEALLDESEGRERNPYLCRSLYWMQLEHYLSLYPPSRIHVLYYEALRDRRRETLRALFRFLGVDESFEASAFERVHHETRHKRSLTPTGQRVRQLLTPALARLSQDGRERVGALLTRPFSRRVERPVLDASVEARLCDRLRSDSRNLQEFVGSAGPGWSV
jgi:hypothetical protein